MPISRETARALSPLNEHHDTTRVIAVPWRMFEAWFKSVWEPGQHIALIAPTGEGKSHLAIHLMRMRKWALALDAKGGDETLERSGFQKIFSWPPPSKVRDEIADGKPARLIVGGSNRTARDMAALGKNMRDAVTGVRSEGGWAVYCDEFGLLADRRLQFRLGDDVEAMLISARSRGTSVVTAFQQAAWVPKASTRQATFVFIWSTRDVNMVKSVAESMGRDGKELIAAVRELPKFHFICIPKDVHAPMVISVAPKEI